MQDIYKRFGVAEKTSLNLAIVGGGKTCKSLLELLQKDHLNIRILGVCEIEEQAEGFLLAKEMGIYTTTDFRELFKIRELDCIVELTHNKDALNELTKHKPDRIGILEYNIALLLIYLFDNHQKQKEAEQQALFAKISSDVLVQQTNAAILLLDRNFKIMDANEAYLNLVKKSKEDIIGNICYKTIRGPDTICPDSEGSEFKCPMMETLKTGESSHIIHEIRVSENQTNYYNIVTYPLKNLDGEIVLIVELRRDITKEISSKWENHIRLLKADMRKSIQEDRMISLGKLVASCVHEINNPIQGMLTFSHLMQDILNQDGLENTDFEKFKEFLSLMSKELERCGNIVSGLLSFSRESPTEYKELVLNEVIANVITLTQHKMQLNNIRLNTRIPSAQLMMTGNTNQLQQAILNLIFNAIEAMPDGGKLTISLKQDKSKKNAVIEVKDTGCGISEKNLDHIFDPFFTTKDEGKGTGLGLSILYGITKDHGGTVNVKTEPGKGSSFILAFPIRR